MRSVLLVALGLVASLPAQAQLQELVANCTTTATGLDGTRENCLSKRETIRAPEGHVFVQNGASVRMTRKNGSENSCRHGFEDMVAVVPGSKITQPQAFWLQAQARSPKGNGSGRGWTECQAALEIEKYTR